MIFQIKEYKHELVAFGSDATSGLKAIIAIHSTKLGPSLGGCRIFPYKNEQDAVEDALRLSAGMTKKAALANLKLGGGKSVIIGHPKRKKSRDLLLAMGDFVEKMKGQYIIAEDVGSSVHDMQIIRERTKHVVGLSLSHGGSGDPSIFTALGTLKGIKAAALYKFGDSSLKGRKVIVQGLGHVGSNLCSLLHKEKAHLLVYDPLKSQMNKAVKEYGATPLAQSEVLTTKADIFAPCALGGILSDLTIPNLKVSIVAGAANNQLKKEANGLLLKKYNILYAPDFVINAGGLINVSYEGPFYKKSAPLNHLDCISSTLNEIFSISESENIPTSQAADLLAKERLNRASL